MQSDPGVPDAAQREALIYLDYNATTPIDPRVFEEMRPYFLEHFANAASRQHLAGQRAAAAVEAARGMVADAIGAEAREIVWTSGATESDNLALKGVAHSRSYAKRRHIVTVVTEHKAVLDPCATLEQEGYRVTRLGVDSQGMIDLEQLASVTTEETLLVSVMHANNETGVLHPIAEIGRLCQQRGTLFHTDAAQSFGKQPIDVQAMGIDLLSASAHKLCGPKGVGFLFLRRRPRVRCDPLIDGGGHERGFRSGTLNVPGIVGFGAAARISQAEASSEQQRFCRLRDRLERALIEHIDAATINGASDRRLANTSNLSFAGVDAESLIRRMPDVAVSSSAACTSAAFQDSHVLHALGASQERVSGSLRFSLGRFTTESEVDRTVEIVVAAVAAERAEGSLPACH